MQKWLKELNYELDKARKASPNLHRRFVQIAAKRGIPYEKAVLQAMKLYIEKG